MKLIHSTLFFLWFSFLYNPCCYAQDQKHTNADTSKKRTPQELVEAIKKANAEDYEDVNKELLNYNVWDNGAAAAYYEIGFFFFQEGKYQTSIMFLDSIIKHAKTLHRPDLVTRAYNVKGHTYSRKGNNQKALDFYHEAIRVAKQSNNIDREVVSNTGLLVTLSKTDQYDKAVKVSQFLIKNLPKTSFVGKENHARTLTTINDMHLSMEAYDSVLHYADIGIKISKDIGFKKGLIDLYIKKGIVFYKKEKYEEAFDYLQKAEHILKDKTVKNKGYATANVNYFMASSCYKTKKINQAINYGLKNIQLLEVNDLQKIPPIIQTHLLLANCYRKKEDFEKALYWNDRYITLNADYQKNLNTTVDKTYKREEIKLKEEIGNLKKAQLAEEQNKKRLIGGLVLVSLASGFLLLYYFRKQRSNKKTFKNLIEKISHFEAKEQESIKRKDTLSIDDQKVDQILKKLRKLEEQEYFLKPECSLSSLAKKTKTNTNYLSKIIHEHEQKHVKDYINDLRIQYTLKKIKNDKKFRSFSVKSIALEIGYKSDNSFTKHFRAKTGLNPSYYIKNIEKLEQQSLH